MHPEDFESEGFIISAVQLRPEHTIVFEDKVSSPRTRKFKAIITSMGGELSHAVVVAREMNLPCLIADADFVNRIKPGDRIEIMSDGVVNVNGGDPNFVKQDKVDMVSALFRFVFSKGEGKVAKINQANINSPGTTHPALLAQLEEEGFFSWEDYTTASFGYINEDGSVDQGPGEIPDQNVFESWIDHMRREHNLPSGKIRRIDVSQ